MLPYFGIFDNLQYRVDGSVVTLYGQVTRPVLKSDAAGVVKHIEGVTRVDNQIEVLPLSPMDDRIRIWLRPGLSMGTRHCSGTPGERSLRSAYRKERERDIGRHGRQPGG